MATADNQFIQFWASNAPRVSLWADSSYGPLVEKDMVRIAQEMSFPLSNFTMSYDAGLTVVGCDNHGGGSELTPNAVVLIQMGYNDDADLNPDKVAAKMRKQKWYCKLYDSRHVVKFVIFIYEPTYKMTVPPASKKQAKKFVKGTVTEGSKFTSQAIQLCQQELGIPAFEMRSNSAGEFFEGMVQTDASGTAWQVENTLLWEDNVHPTAKGGETHFRSVIKAFQARYAGGGSGISAQQAEAPAPDYSTFMATQGGGFLDYSMFGVMGQASTFQQVSWQGNGDTRSRPY